MLSARLNAAELAEDDDPLSVEFDFDRAPTDALESLNARKVKKRDGNEDIAETFSWNWRDTWQEQHREAFVVAKMAKADMLKEVHDSLRDAMENGTPYAVWRKKMEASLKDRWIGKTHGELWDELPDAEKDKRIRRVLGTDWDDLSDDEKQLKRENWLSAEQREKRVAASRLRTIYYTNSIVSSQAGQYKQLMKQAEDYPYWRYKTANDNRVRESHHLLHNKVFRYNDLFWNTHYPPNGWFCRCSVEALDEYDLKHLEDKEIKVEDGGSHISWKTLPNGDEVAVWQDGEERVECAPGWSYNVGRPGYRQQVLEEKAKGYPESLREQIAAESKKIDQEQSERREQLEKIAQQFEEKRKKRQRSRVQVARNPQPSDTPLKLQRQFRKEENELIASLRNQERFEAIASGNRKLMRELRKKEEAEVAKLREQQRKQLEEVRQQTIDSIADSAAKGCGNDLEKANELREVFREQANNLTYDELQIMLHAVSHPDMKHNFLRNGIKNVANVPGFYHGGGIKPGVNIDLWNTNENGKHLNPNGKIDSNNAGHELGHSGDWSAGSSEEVKIPLTIMERIKNLFYWVTNKPLIEPKTAVDMTPATALPPIREELYNAAMKDIRSFLSMAVEKELSNFDIEKPSKRVQRAYKDILLDICNDDVKQVGIQAFTVAVALYSKGQLLPPKGNNVHFKVHNNTVCKKQGGIEGGNSELFACIFGARFTGHKGVLTFLDSVMPNVMNIYPNIIWRIANQLEEYYSPEGVEYVKKRQK